MKKIILFCISLISVFLFMSSSFAKESTGYKAGQNESEKLLKEAQLKYNNLSTDRSATIEQINKAKEEVDNLKKASDIYKGEYTKASAEEKAAAIAKEAERTKSCATSKNCMDKSTFEINTSEFSIGGTGLKDTSAEKTINKTFGVFIKKMMIGLIMLSSFIMTVGAGYMILYFGQDEYLTRGKTIFKMGLVSIIIALSSYYMVNLVTYILYQ